MWGLMLARGLAIVNTVLTVMLFIVALVTRAGILTSLVGLILWGFVVIYLFGSSEFFARAEQYYAHLRRPERRGWEGYR
jgi:cobalamin biosynthesis protein CobD/CbiB